MTSANPPRAEKQSRSKKWLLWLRLVGIGLFVVILFKVDLSEVLQQLAAADVRLFLTGLFFQVLVLAFKGIRWHVMNDGQKGWVFWRQSLGRFYESYAIGVVTPARVGELLKAGHEQDTSNIFASGIRVLAERGLDIGFFVALAGISSLTGSYIQWPPLYNWLIIAAGIAVLVVSMLLLASASFNNLINYLMKLLPGKLKAVNITQKKYSFIAASNIITVSLLSNISYFVSCYFLALSVGLEAGFIWISGAVAVSGLLNMLPITIMGIGTRELTFLYVFRSFAQTLVLSFSFVVMLVAQIGGGLLALLAGQLLLHAHKKNENE